jgi:hypothetical protein
VKYATDVETQVHYAIKMFSREAVASPQLAASIKREIAVMKHVRHPNIVSLREVLASKTHIFIVLELVTGGELFDRIVTSGAHCTSGCATCAARALTRGAARRQAGGAAGAGVLPAADGRGVVLPRARRVPPRPQAREPTAGRRWPP